MTPSIAHLLPAIIARYGSTPERILGRSRRPEDVRPRHALWVSLVDGGHAYSEVGRLLGVDHTAVLEAVRNWRERESGQRKVRRCSGQATDGEACLDTRPCSERFLQEAG